MDTHLHVYIRTVWPLTTTGGSSAQIKDHVYFYMHGVPSELLADLFIRLLYRSAIVLASTMSRYLGGNYIVIFVFNVILLCIGACYWCTQELMSRPKGGRSVQLRGTAFESERSRHFPYMDIFSSGA